MKDEGNRIIRNTFFISYFATIVSSLAFSIGGVVDGVIIGQCLGLDSISAFALVSPVTILLSLFTVMVSVGGRNRLVCLVGSGELDRARGVFTLSMILSVGSAILITIMILLFRTPVAVLLGATGNSARLLDKTRGYLLGYVIGLPAMNATWTLRGYMGVDNNRTLTVISAFVVTVSDILLDLFVVFVIHGDTFEMGLATSVSYYISLLVLMTHFRRKERLIRFTFRRIPWNETGAILWKGLPNGAGRVANTIRGVLINRLLAASAVTGCIAAYSVHRQADSLLNCLIIGMADVVAVITTLLAGEENRPMIKRLFKTSFIANLAISGSTAAVLFLIAPFFASLFIKGDPLTLENATGAVRFYAIGMPFYGMNIIYQCYLEGIGRNRMAMAFSIMREAGILVLSTYALFPAIGVRATWVSFPVTQLILLFITAGYIAVVNRRLGMQPEGFFNRVLLLPRDFDVPDEDRLDKTITTKEEVIELSGAAWDFCEAHGCDKRRMYAISLAVEEMAFNTVQEGFRPGKHNSIDMRIIKKGDEYIVRIRDDCLIFDPVKQLKLYSDEVPMHHMGLRLVISMAKDVQYTAALRLNNLVVRV